MPELEKIKLPNGADFILRMAYSSKEAHGVTVLVVISCFSLIAVIGLVGAISLSAYNTRSSMDQHLFVRTHVAAYFMCLLVCDLLQATGSIMNSTWVRQMSVSVGDYCTAQAVIKQMADVATAFWSLVIAIHTFCLLVLQIKLRQFVLWTTLFGGWSAIFAVVIAGPASLETYEKGPFFAISGYWCWISPDYGPERITLDYMIMFLSAAFSFTLYTMIYLKLRGNLILNGWRVRFVRVSAENLANWRGRKLGDESLQIAKQMLLYPIAYVILLFPIAVTRFATWSGHDIPFEATIFSAAVFLCSGVVNVTLFACTRPVLPPKSMRIWRISQPTIVHPPSPKEDGEDEYYSSRNDPYYQGYSQQKVEQKKDMMAHLEHLNYDDSRRSFESDASEYSTASPGPQDHYSSQGQMRSSDLPPQVPQLAHLSERADDHSHNNRHSLGADSDYSIYDEHDLDDYDDHHHGEYNDVNLASPPPARAPRSYFPNRR